MKDNNSRGGISFFGLMTIAFVVLKLTGYITWSWRWVLAPTWIPLALVLVCLLVLGVATYIKENQK
ncbi:hypothetical protein [Allobaculum mucilyticum]|uniref:hypothetical protein n=1 Tax=Allobaculum mucilyticum TaxID=2834459 RepID=UPI001E2D7107|nr:hypothetical protein [Allobaculum mucilyticum]UNT97140.1 hypothetical protein KWG62_05165 [Allobaculum mucilyticum]